MITLWIDAFGDEPSEVEAFFDRFFSERTALVMRENARVVSMLFLLPSAVMTKGTKRLVGYIYGGATDQRERGKGYYRRLLSFAQTVAKEQGMKALFLHPANQTLDDSYARMGFTVPLFASERVTPDQIALCEATPLSAREYMLLRQRLLNKQAAAYVDWNEAVLAHCLTWCHAFAFKENACVLVAHDWSSVYEYIGADADEVCVPSQAPLVPAHWRCVGENTVVGRLYPLDDSLWEMPVYMGYGME